MAEMTLAFDRNGHLLPYDIVSAEWDMVVAVLGSNDRRKELLSAYENFLMSLVKLLPIRHRHWIDGSFVSQRPEPGDIDVVIFVPHSHFAGISDGLKRLKNDVKDSIDCYFVETFPPDHPKHEIGRADELDWYYFLRTDRRKRQKEILEIWFDYGNQ